MPYRSIEVGRFEQLTDHHLALADGGARPPPATLLGVRPCLL